MPRKKSTAVPKIKASAKASAEAKAIFSHKKEIKETIPEDVTRAKAGAWLDLISPLTEWAGLRGDKLRHKREVLRLQREDTLAEIAHRARRRLPRDLTTISPVPLKFIVPFLEQASLEDPESVLVDLWANLLVSASKEFGTHHIHFVSIISRISPSQGQILKEIIGTESLDALNKTIETLAFRSSNPFSFENVFRSYLSGFMLNRQYTQDMGDKLFAQAVVEFCDWAGLEMVRATYRNNRNKYRSVEFAYSQYKDGKEVDYSILEAIGLVTRVKIDYFDAQEWSLELVYYRVTYLGFEFAKACKIVT
jgi:hypothetical protein